MWHCLLKGGVEEMLLVNIRIILNGQQQTKNTSHQKNFQNLPTQHKELILRRERHSPSGAMLTLEMEYSLTLLLLASDNNT